MTSTKGEDVVAPGWNKLTQTTSTGNNTPDVNNATGSLNTTIGYNWSGGLPIASADGGSWQNVYRNENFTQIISGLNVGTTYFFKYYYTTQGITGYGETYNTPYAPNVTITGASGYLNPGNPGLLFKWNTYCGELIATSSTVTNITHP